MGAAFDRLSRNGREIGDAVDVLARLNGPDLTSVLLEVFRRRRTSVTDLPHRHAESRFTRPSPVAFEAIREAETRVLGAVPEWVELVQLAPATPLGAHVALGGSSQDRLVSTVRRTEMAADPTLGLALELASRRRGARQDLTLATCQRVTRAQSFEGEHSYGHFTLFGMATAGRDRGALAFERWAAVQHLAVMIEAVTAAGGDHVEISVIDPTPGQPILRAVFEAIGDEVSVRASARPLGEYYVTARFGLTAEIRGVRLDVGDGGFTGWTAKMLSDRKERLCISGMGVDRLAVSTQRDDPPGTP